MMPKSVQLKAGCRLDADYPLPIVDARIALKEARDKIFAIKSTGAARSESKKVYQKHGSRRRPQAAPKVRSPQRSFPF